MHVIHINMREIYSFGAYELRPPKTYSFRHSAIRLFCVFGPSVPQSHTASARTVREML